MDDVCTIIVAKHEGLVWGSGIAIFDAPDRVRGVGLFVSDGVSFQLVRDWHQKW